MIHAEEKQSKYAELILNNLSQTGTAELFFGSPKKNNTTQPHLTYTCPSNLPPTLGVAKILVSEIVVHIFPQS